MLLDVEYFQYLQVNQYNQENKKSHGHQEPGFYERTLKLDYTANIL